MATIAGSAAAPSYMPSTAMAVSVRDVTFSNSYTTGGEAITPSQIGLSVIYFAHPNIKASGGSATGVYWNGATGKLQAFTGAGEVANATNLSALVAEVVFLASPEPKDPNHMTQTTLKMSPGELAEHIPGIEPHNISQQVGRHALPGVYVEDMARQDVLTVDPPALVRYLKSPAAEPTLGPYQGHADALLEQVAA